MGGPSTTSAIQVIAAATLVAGTLDIASAFTLARLNGVPPKRLLQMIASAAIGKPAFEGGTSTAALGLAFHFLIAASAATVYYVLGRYLALNAHAILSGILYGIAVHLFMTFIVLSRTKLQRPFSMKPFLTQLVVHIFFVGLPIALVVRHFAA